MKNIQHVLDSNPVYSRDWSSIPTLMTSQGSDTVTSIFKCNSSNTIKSLRLLKMG